MSGSIASYSGTNSDGATDTLKCETIMRLEIYFLVFNCQKNYQSQTPLFLNLTCDWQIDATWHRLSSLLNKRT